MKQRDFNGYQQVMGTGGDWQFVITGFDDSTSGQAGFCTVLRENGETERVEIDAQDRILIDGVRYGRRNWYH